MPYKDYNNKMKEYMLSRYYARRAEAFVILGNECTHCGNTNQLEIDHIDWRDKEIRLNKLWSIAKDRFIKELLKCQLLCKQCHSKKTRKDLSEIKSNY